MRTIAAVVALVAGAASAGCTNPVDPPSPAGGSPDASAPSRWCVSCTILVSGQSNPSWIAADRSSLYWIDEGVGYDGTFTPGRVMRANLDGTGVATLAPDQSTPEQLVLDDANAYWLNAGTAANQFADGAVMRASKGGGGPVTLASGASYGLLGIDASHLYWTAGNVLWQSAKDGTSRTALAQLSSPTALAVDASGVYVVDGPDLDRVATDGSGATVLASLAALSGVTAIAPGASSLYVMGPGGNNGEAALLAIGKADGAVTNVQNDVAPGWDTSQVVGSAQGIAVDAHRVYFTIDEGTRGELFAVPVAGGTSTLLASTDSTDGAELGTAGFVTVGPSGVYATTPDPTSDSPAGSGEIVRVR